METHQLWINQAIKHNICTIMLTLISLAEVAPFSVKPDDSVYRRMLKQAAVDPLRGNITK